VQRSEDIIHVVAETIEDRTGWLSSLMEDVQQFANPLARADHVARPGRDQREPAARHPRRMRIMPDSRDFH
jgi:error-prone DNA polymerase